MALDLKVNGTTHAVDVDPATPLLWVLRDQIGLTGTKFSCGIAQCGACTVHVDGQPTRSCSFPVSAAVGKSVTTIEGLSRDGSHPLQLAWLELDAPQCGYCQSGMIVSAPDDTVTVRIAQTELGQGVWTSNAMMVAEELQCDWSKVVSQYASANRDAREMAPEWTLNVPGKGGTDPKGGGTPEFGNRA